MSDNNTSNSIPKGVFCTKNDRMITSRVMKLKGFDWASKELSRKRFEKYARLSYSSNCVRISEKNLSAIYSVVHETAGVLGIDTPDVYLLRSSRPVAFCIGETEPMLIVSTEAIKLLSNNQLKVFITQALIHIHSEHLKSFMVRDLIRSASDNFGIFKSAVALPRMLLEEWAIEAEITADRGTLCVIKDLDLILETYGVLATGGVGATRGEFLLSEYEEYVKNSNATPVCPLFRTWSDLYMGNERYIYRAGVLKEFSESKECADWSNGNFSSNLNADSDDISEDEEKAYFDGLRARGDVWEAEDVHERIAFGLPDTKATAEF